MSAATLKQRKSRFAFTRNRAHIVLEVRDNGKGFSVTENTESLGIVGIKERAQSCGGDMLVVSSPGEGTTVILRVPVISADQKIRRPINR